MSFGIAGGIEVYLQQIQLLVGIDKEIEAEELETPVLVLDLPAVEDGVGDDEVGLLVVAVPELVGGGGEGEEVVEHEGGRSGVVVCCFVDGVVGEVDLWVQLAKRERLM